MEVATVREGATVVARVSGRVSGLATAAELQKALEGAFTAGDEALVVDFADVPFISSAGLRTIAIILNRTQAAKVDFVVSSLSDPVREVFAMTGFDQLVRVVDDLDEARRVFAH